jgi:hypothetical protein
MPSDLPQPVNTPQMAAFLKSYAKVSKERDLLLCAVLAIRNIKISIPFDAAAAATKCIQIAAEALAQLIENQRKPDVDPAGLAEAAEELRGTNEER